MVAGQQNKAGEWRIVPDETSFASITLTHEEYHVKATVKWDGCNHLWFDGDVMGEEACYHHICDIDDFIAVLQGMKKRAEAYFYGELGVGTIPENEVVNQIAMQQEIERPR